MIRILAFSDLHRDAEAARAILAAADGADLILGAGDFCTRHDGLPEIMDILAPLSDRAVYVCGNHETADDLRAATAATVLHGDTVTMAGLRIVGLGAEIPPVDKPWHSVGLTEGAAATRLAAIPAADILLTHSPPKGIADVNDDLGSIGSTAIRAAAERLRPRLLLCGHVHDCWGQGGHIGPTEVRNLGPGLTWFDLPEARP